jgi:2-dehydro-3-deoxyphosphogluconate aldolase/(4S)-4-hydroxy-2-oxoglutarate aldolase
MHHEFEGAMARVVESGVVAVMRGTTPERAVDVGTALLEGGVTALEVTADADDPAACIEALREAVGGDAVVGAGTVLDAPTTRELVAAGAAFVVSPTVEPDVVAACAELDVPVAPGAFTPTEVCRADDLGADVVKVFPAATGGPGHLRRIGGPLPDVPLLPTGGVSVESAPEYVEAGAVAVGAGGALVGDGEDLAAVTERARAFVEAVDGAR